MCGRHVQADGRLDSAPMFGRKNQPKDFLRREAAERRKQEDEQPWFLAEDDGPDLEVEAGRSARMDDDRDLGPGRP